LTITRVAHGHVTGNRAIIHNTNVDYQVAVITSYDADTFTVACSPIGNLSGSDGAYSMGFNFAHNAGAGSINGGTLSAPSGGDAQLMSIRIHLAVGTRTGTIYALTVPKGNVNGVGPDTGMDDIIIPNQAVRQDGNSLVVVASTIVTNTAGDFGTFQWGALPASTTGIHILANF
jgi:hypothetical protein